MSKNSYKVYPKFGESSKSATLFSAILATGARSSFIRLSDLATSLQAFIKTLDSYLTIRKASGKKVPIVGTIFLVLHIGKSQETITFLLSKRLATQLLIGCHYFEVYVESIQPRLWMTESVHSVTQNTSLLSRSTPDVGRSTSPSKTDKNGIRMP